MRAPHRDPGTPLDPPAWLEPERTTVSGVVEQAPAAARATGDRRARANLHADPRVLHEDDGKHVEALDHARQTLAIADGPGEAMLHRRTLDPAGHLHHRVGTLADAVRGYVVAPPVHRSIGERYDEALTPDRPGDTLAASGDHDAARRLWSGAVTAPDGPGRAAAHRAQAEAGPP
ncbi:hypothetical protein FHX81_4950 [Saccharothrix saharensis]|uniref:Tetratricopeptide repeat protein n=1 Tax=Saccharothrix saharensis TaxID=571190 RepID=A0A543JI55_9PSEU|nr:hypothetical protein [Saccharothrix saharensis]TQM82542.1 hypothetical protein FHX81_4950 [Saccharothrix saharensis]